MKGVTRSPELIRAVRVLGEREKDGVRGEVERKLDRRRHEHIFRLQIIRFPQVADVLKQTALTQVHNHLVNSGAHAETQTV